MQKSAIKMQATSFWEDYKKCKKTTEDNDIQPSILWAHASSKQECFFSFPMLTCSCSAEQKKRQQVGIIKITEYVLS
jgi:hypothetical protein